MIKNLPAMEGRPRFDPQDGPLEKEMATHSSILAWRIPWTEKPGWSPWGYKESDTTELLTLTLIWLDRNVHYIYILSCLVTFIINHKVIFLKFEKIVYANFILLLYVVWILYIILVSAAHEASPSLGFSRQEHWSGLPFPSPMHESEKWKWSRFIVSDS